MIRQLSERIGFSYALELLELKSGLKDNARFVVSESNLPTYYKILKPLGLRMALSQFAVVPVESKSNVKVPEYNDYMRRVSKNSAAKDKHFIMYVSSKDPLVLAENETNHIAMGRLLGYPECCIQDFAVRAQNSNKESVKLLFNDLALLHSKSDLRAHPFLMNLLYKDDSIKLLSHVPFSLECEKSRKLASMRFNLLENIDPFCADEIAEKLRGTHYHNGSRFEFF